MINKIQLKDSIEKYLNSMDKVSCGEGKLFKVSSQKSDLETKIWNLFYKIEAAEYHENRVKSIAQSMRDEIKDLKNENNQKHKSNIPYEMTIEVEKKEILFEVDTFFMTSRSALDFIASILSRYIKGKQTDKIRDIIKYLNNSKNDFEMKTIILNMWHEWGQNLIEYRDYLVHYGSLKTPKAIATKINSNIGNRFDENEVSMGLQINKEEYIVFPLPIKPNKRLRITRMNNWYEEEIGEVPEGFSKEERLIMWQSEERKHVLKQISYTLDRRYLEADKLCSTYFNQLIEFCFNVFEELFKVNFQFLL